MEISMSPLPNARPRTRNVLMIDIDGTLAPEHGDKAEPNHIPTDVIDALRLFYEAGDMIMIVTGAPWCLAKKVVEKLGFPEVAIAADYGVAIQRPDGREDLNIDLRQYEKFVAGRQRLTELLRRVGGLVDERHTRFQVNGFFSDREAWERGRELFGHAVAADPELSELFIGSKNDGEPPLRQQWNQSDSSVNLLTFDGNKAAAVRWAKLHGFQVIVAAGDSGSDKYILQAAHEDGGYPIVTRRAPDDHPPAVLTDIASRAGDRGYVAPTHLLDGYGLAEGLRLAWAKLHALEAA